MSMGARPTGDADCFREERKGNVRFRLHEINGEKGKQYAVETSVYSTFTEEWKLLHFIGSFDLRTATEIFENMVSGILDYSWMDDALLLEGEA